VKVNPSARVLEIRDGQTGNPLTFRATAEQLSGIRPGDRVLIKYTEDGGSLVVEEVQVLR
jgi:hypothetical protein